MKSALAGLALVFLAVPALAQTKSVSLAQITVTPNASAYSAGQCLGGVLTLPGMIQPSGPGGTLMGAVTFVDPQNQGTTADQVNILLFNKQPTGTYTDHSTCTLAAADAPNLVAILPIATANCSSTGLSATVCTLIPNMGVPVNGAMPIVSSNLWAIPVINGTPNYGASASLYFTFSATPFAF